MPFLKDLLDVIKGLKRRKPGLRICPRCRSLNIRLSSSFDLWLTPEQYVCKDCGYKGPIILELEKEE